MAYFGPYRSLIEYFRLHSEHAYSGYPLIMLAYSAQAYPRFMSCQLLLQMMFSRFTVRQRMLHAYQGLNGVLLQRAAYSKPSAALSRKRNAVNIAITGDGKKLRALWDSESSVMPSTYHSVWLRHNCQCPQCLSSYNQTVLLSYELDPKVAISEAHVSGRLLLYCVYALGLMFACSFVYDIRCCGQPMPSLVSRGQTLPRGENSKESGHARLP